MTPTAPKCCPGCKPEYAGVAPRVNTANGESFWVFCPECGMHGPAGFSEAYAIERWDSLCRPNPETQAVAWLCPHGSKPRLLFPEEMVDKITGEDVPLYRSPVESVPVAVLEKLVEEWRETASRTDADKRYAGHLRKCADRLSAIVRGEK